MNNKNSDRELEDLSQELDELIKKPTGNLDRNSQDAQYYIYEERLNLLEEFTRKFDEKFAALESYVRQLGSNVIDLCNQKIIFSQAFSSLSQKVESLEIKELSEDKQGKSGIVNLDSPQDEVKIAELEKKVMELISKETQMENQILGLKDEVKELRTQNSQMQEEISNLRSEMDNFRAEMKEQFLDNLRAKKNQSLEDGQADNRNNTGFNVTNIGNALFDMLGCNNSSEPSVLPSPTNAQPLGTIQNKDEITL